MKYIVVILSLCCCSAFGQMHHYDRKAYDFSGVKIEKIDRAKIHRQIDSLYRTSGIDSLAQLSSYASVRQYTPRYVAFLVGYESGMASLSSLNSGLETLGLHQVSETFSGIPWGFAFRGNHLLWTYTVTPSFNKTTSNQDFKIKASSVAMEMNIGYDVINARRFQLYPQVGLSLQYLDLTVLRKASLDDIQDVNDLVFKSSSVNLSRATCMLSYGLEADYHVKYSEGGAGIIVGLRYGMTTDLVEGKFKIDRQKSAFTLDDRMRESYFSVVVKVYGKDPSTRHPN